MAPTRLRVLLVDDNVESCELYAYAFEQAGYARHVRAPRPRRPRGRARRGSRSRDLRHRSARALAWGFEPAALRRRARHRDRGHRLLRGRARGRHIPVTHPKATHCCSSARARQRRAAARCYSSGSTRLALQRAAREAIVGRAWGRVRGMTGQIADLRRRRWSTPCRARRYGSAQHTKSCLFRRSDRRSRA